MILSLVIASLLSAGAPDGTPVVAPDHIVIEDGGPAVNYRSRHSLSCGGSRFELTIDSPGPARVHEIVVDGKRIASDTILEINSGIPQVSWFNSLATSCTRRRQSLTLQLSTDRSGLYIPLVFEDGALIDVKHLVLDAESGQAVHVSP